MHFLVISVPVVHSDIPNLSLPLLSNGPSATISNKTDRFAMGLMIYELETGVQAEISSGMVISPHVIYDRGTRLNLLLGCVLFSLLAEHQIQKLAERYGWRPDDERRFVISKSGCVVDN